MASLQNKIPSETYPGLLHIQNDSSDAQAIDGTLRVVEDGLGTDTILSLSTSLVQLGAINFDATGITNTLVLAEDLTVTDDCIIGDDLTVNGDCRINSDLTVIGDIIVTSDIVHSGDANNYISPGTDEWEVYTGGVKRFEIANTAVTTSDVSFIASSSSLVSPYPLYTIDSTGFVGIGNQSAPTNLLHLKVEGANVDNDHKFGDNPSPEDANWMKDTFIVIENTHATDGSNNNSGANDTFMFNVSTGLKFRQKVYGDTSVFSTGMIEVSPRPASVTSATATHNSKMDIWLAAGSSEKAQWRRMSSLKAYGYAISNPADGTYASTYEGILCVGPDANTKHGGYISTIGCFENHEDFAHPMHYTDIDDDDTDGSDMGIGDYNFCESLNLVKTHVMYKEGDHSGENSIANAYAAGICLQPRYDISSPATDFTVDNHNYISILAVRKYTESGLDITNSNLLNFDFDPDGSQGQPIKNNTTIGSHVGSIYITVGDVGSQNQYIIPFYNLS